MSMGCLHGPGHQPAVEPPVEAEPARAPTVVVPVVRHQAPLIRLEGQPLSVGLLLVYADDELLEKTRSDLWNVSGIVVKAVRDYFRSAGSGVQVVDYTDLGFEMWTRPRTEGEKARDPLGVRLDPWPGVPLGVTTSLVTVVKVKKWNVGPATADWSTGEGTGMGLLMSTWTREGQPVSTEYIEAYGRTGGALKFLSKEAAVDLYEEVRAPHRQPLPGEWTEMFWAVVREAVGLHYFAFLPAEVPESVTLVGREEDAGVKAFREARYEDALESWRREAEANPRAHGALYDAALAQVMLGRDREALSLLARAWQVEDTPLYRTAWERVLRRLKRTQVMGGAKVRTQTPEAAVPREPGAARCFIAEREPNQDPRWARGLSLDIEEELLAEYHPAECDHAGVRCAIDFYQVKFFNDIWSERLQPGLNDLDETPNYDGTRRRRWALFYDHELRYRYCAR